MSRWMANASAQATASAGRQMRRKQYEAAGAAIYGGHFTFF